MSRCCSSNREGWWEFLADKEFKRLSQSVVAQHSGNELKRDFSAPAKTNCPVLRLGSVEVNFMQKNTQPDRVRTQTTAPRLHSSDLPTVMLESYQWRPLKR